MPSWSTSFEDGFCGYAEMRGFCYSDPDATYSLIRTPSRSGGRAAAFTITTDEAKTGDQARCVREGYLPQEAYYGAWFHIPERAMNNGNWNLMHFRGAEEGTTDLHGLWDVSITTTDDGRMLPRLIRTFGMPMQQPEHTDVELPVGQWFSLQVRLKRDAAAAGAAALYFNGQLVAELTDIVTDDSDWGQWYVGNLATNLEPVESTIYVDDVSIQSTLTLDN